MKHLQCFKLNLFFMFGNFQRGQTHFAGYFLCLLIVYCFCQGDMGPAGSVGPIGPQVYILLGYVCCSFSTCWKCLDTVFCLKYVIFLFFQTGASRFRWTDGTSRTQRTSSK